MNNSRLLTILYLVVLFSFFVSSEKTLWENCSTFQIDLPVIGQTTFNQCTQLIEAEECKLLGRFLLNQQQIFEQQVDLTGQQPTICQPIPNLPACQACVSILDAQNTTNKCASVYFKCGILTSGSQSLGCFDASAIVTEIMNCQYKCPQDCSGKGYCDKGICVCQTGYYGSTCNISIPTYGGCISIPIGDTPQQLCGEFQYIDCGVNFNIRLGSQNIYTKQFPLYQFISTFQTPYCFSVYNCSMCLEWTNLQLAENDTSGCSKIKYGCGGGMLEYPLFCFEDTQIVQYCLGRCPNDCSFHGECKSGKCVCDPIFTGNDCSLEIDCPNNCGGHGTCSKGVCYCEPNYQGSDCTIPTDIQPPSRRKQSSDTFLWGILIAVVVVVVIVIIGVIIYFKIRDRRDRSGFMKLELQEDAQEEF